MTLTQALKVSCNTAFANLGLELGEDKLRQQSEKFGFDSRHLADLGGAASQFPDEMDDAQLALSCDRPVRGRGQPACRWLWSQRPSPTTAC